MKLRSENGESQGDSNLRELGSHHLESRSHHICALTCLSSFQSNSSLCSPLLLSPPADSPVIARPSLSAAFHGKATPSSPGWSRALSPGDPESAGGRGHPSINHRQPLPRRSVHASPRASLQPSTDPWALEQELCLIGLGVPTLSQGTHLRQLAERKPQLPGWRELPFPSAL